ncbi:uncharacterized protein LOC142240499 [Haematobia irritans]|uniref:uncharacterized protein LOC142240499 n=1 Tax=Haematobia irritans TaxID=7368 RepID=UPI003F4FB221
MEKPRKVEWTRNAVMALIDSWSKHDCLFDPENRFHHNKKARTNAISQILEDIKPLVKDLTFKDVKTKTWYLRNSYTREINKQNELIRNAESPDEIYIPTPYWFEKMNFLHPYLKQNLTSDENEFEMMEDDKSLITDHLDEFLCEESPRAQKRARSNDSMDFEIEIDEELIDNDDVNTLDMENEVDINTTEPVPQQIISAAAVTKQNFTANKQKVRVTPAKQTAAKITPAKIGSAKIPPSKLVATKITPIQIKRSPKDPLIIKSTKFTPTGRVAARTPPTTNSLGQQMSSNSFVNDSNQYCDYDTAFVNFIKVNLATVTDTTLKDELTEKITLLMLDYKSKQRKIDNTKNC